MNEFTKDELEIIYLDMTIYANKATPLKESPSHLELRNKVQSMINNYCEHPESYMYRYDNWINYCDKCKSMWKTKNANQ
jgi:hypothetical protein